MIRFVDVTCAYWGEDAEADLLPGMGPQCAFIDTVTDTFVTFDGAQVFGADDEIPRDAFGNRCRGLVPHGFWTR